MKSESFLVGPVPPSPSPPPSPPNGGRWRPSGTTEPSFPPALFINPPFSFLFFFFYSAHQALCLYSGALCPPPPNVGPAPPLHLALSPFYGARCHRLLFTLSPMLLPWALCPGYGSPPHCLFIPVPSIPSFWALALPPSFLALSPLKALCSWASSGFFFFDQTLPLANTLFHVSPSLTPDKPLINLLPYVCSPLSGSPSSAGAGRATLGPSCSVRRLTTSSICSSVSATAIERLFPF
uniref:Uncharacterized protein n=1 Tax=Amphimedon queenslandica TaxID=400682 RepID=A0A1X7TVQ4_AMPQE